MSPTFKQAELLGVQSPVRRALAQRGDSLLLLQEALLSFSPYLLPPSSYLSLPFFTLLIAQRKNLSLMKTLSPPRSRIAGLMKTVHPFI